MNLRMLRSLVLVALCALPAAISAEVKVLSGDGFTVQHSIAVEKDPEAVYHAMTLIGQWWNPDHSWSGQPANLYLDATPGGCFCEHLPDGGGVTHLRIIHLQPGQQIRFEGALGPLQGMAVNGRMLWRIEAAESGSTVTFTYHVMGFMEGGFEGLAPVVDGVIGEQLTRLGAFVTAPVQ